TYPRPPELHALPLHGALPIAVLQWPIDDVAVSGNPPDVGRAPEHLAGAIVEDPLEGQRGPHGITASGVQYALRLSSRSGRIEDRSEEHTSELQSRENLVCRLL